MTGWVEWERRSLPSHQAMASLSAFGCPSLLPPWLVVLRKRWYTDIIEGNLRVEEDGADGVDEVGIGGEEGVVAVFADAFDDGSGFACYEGAGGYIPAV